MKHMSLTAVMLAAVLTAPLAFADDAQGIRKHEAANTPEMALPASTMTLSSIFAAVANPKAERRADGTFVADGPMVHVWVAKLDAEGNLTTHCVNDEHVARSIMERKQTKVATRVTAEEQ